MITEQEAKQDSASERAFAEREQGITSRRKDLASRAWVVDKRAKELQVVLDGLDPKAEARAELVGELEDIAEEVAWIRYHLYRLAADAMATDDGDGYGYRFTALDVEAWCERSVEMGASHPRLNPSQLRDLIRMRQVPNAPFRERFLEIQEEGERSDRDITLDVHKYLLKIEKEKGAEYGSKNFVNGTNPQTRELERQLGLQVKSGNTPSVRLFVAYEVGVALMRALNMTPQEAGL